GVRVRKRHRVLQGWFYALLGASLCVALDRAPAAGDATCAPGDDFSTAVAAIFEGEQPACSDSNGDGRMGAADIVAQLRAAGAPGPAGPTVTFFGIANADGSAATPLGDIDGAPVYFRNVGFGFKIVVEAATGLSTLPAGSTTLSSAPNDPSL